MSNLICYHKHFSIHMRTHTHMHPHTQNRPLPAMTVHTMLVPRQPPLCSCSCTSRHSRGQCCSHIELEEAAAVSPRAGRKEADFLFCFPGQDLCQSPSEKLGENKTVRQSRLLINLQTWHGSLLECYGCSYTAIITWVSQ